MCASEALPLIAAPGWKSGFLESAQLDEFRCMSLLKLWQLAMEIGPGPSPNNPRSPSHPRSPSTPK